MEYQQFGSKIYVSDDDRARQVLPMRKLWRRTGIGLKARFLFALILTALLSMMLFVWFLGDPSGQNHYEQDRQMLLAQASVQAHMLHTVLVAHQEQVEKLARSPLVAQLDRDPETAQAMLQFCQQEEPASMSWSVVQNGRVLISSTSASTVDNNRLDRLANPQPLETLVSQVVNEHLPIASAVRTEDSRIPGGWVAIAAPLSTGEGRVVLTIISLRSLVSDLHLDGRVQAGLEPQDRSRPLLNRGQDVMMVEQDLPDWQLRYWLQTFVSINKDPVLFMGRSVWLLVLATIVLVVLIATIVALPITRRIRRATRQIRYTTREVQSFALNAQRMAQEHNTGVLILTGASRRISIRRQTIIRDSDLIVQLSARGLVRQKLIQQAIHPMAQDQQYLNAVQDLRQLLLQIRQVSVAMADGMKNDTTLDQLNGAMESAQDIAQQFQGAGEHLELGAEQLEAVAESLL